MEQVPVMGKCRRNDGGYCEVWGETGRRLRHQHEKENLDRCIPSAASLVAVADDPGLGGSGMGTKRL